MVVLSHLFDISSLGKSTVPKCGPHLTIVATKVRSRGMLTRMLTTLLLAAGIFTILVLVYHHIQRSIFCYSKKKKRNTTKTHCKPACDTLSR